MNPIVAVTNFLQNHYKKNYNKYQKQHASETLVLYYINGEVNETFFQTPEEAHEYVGEIFDEYGAIKPIVRTIPSIASNLEERVKKSAKSTKELART